MPILPFPLDEEERRRRLAEQAMTIGAFPRDDPPNDPPDVPAPRLLPHPPSSGIPGEIPGGPMLGARGSSPLPEAPGSRGMALPTPNIPGGEKYGIPGVRASRPPSRYDELAEMKGAYVAGAPGRGKSALTGALEGFLGGGGLLGAATGAAYGAIDPRRLRERQFERYEKPEILERFAFEDVDRARARQAEEDALNAEYKRAQIGELGSRSEIARENTKRQSAVGQSQIDLNNARAEAARTGTPSYVDIDEGGKITKYQVFPNGMMRPVGASGAAAISRANIKSREGIASRREAGANARAARRQAKKTSKTFTMEDVDDAVAETGLSELKIKQRFIEKGYREVK